MLLLYVSVAFVTGVVISRLINSYLESSPEILTRSTLKRYGLPMEDKRYSHIFNQDKGKRITAARVLLDELEPKKREDENRSIKHSENSRKLEAGTWKARKYRGRIGKKMKERKARHETKGTKTSKDKER